MSDRYACPLPTSNMVPDAGLLVGDIPNTRWKTILEDPKDPRCRDFLKKLLLMFSRISIAKITHILNLQSGYLLI